MSSRRLPLLATLPLAVALASVHADTTVYADQLAAGFEDWSWGDAADFANPAPVHAGAYSIALTGNAWNALSIHSATRTFDTATTGLRFWLHGGASGNQELALSLERAGTPSAVVPLNTLGVIPAAGQWKQVDLPFASIPALAAFGAYDRFSLQSNRASAQPVLYVDDITITESSGQPDPIFANGFDGSGPPPANGLVIERGVAIDGLAGDRFTWRDRANQPRVAVLAHNDGGSGTGGTRGGELREFRYQVGGATRIVKATADAFGGFGYVVSHPASEAICTGGGDPSGLGHFTPGQFQRVFEGRHHAIFRFTQAYPRYCTTAAPAQQFNLPVTIDWVFSTGRDDPLWSVTWDLSAVPVNRLEDDARGPYGQMRIDGAASDGARAPIAGVAWGDYYRFTTTTSPVTFGSAWTWNQPNTVPFVKLWTSGVDATMGLVQTQTIRQQDAGGYWGQDSWGRTSAQGNACPDGYLMPCDYNWPFQSINYELYGGATQNARLAWGTNFGFLGQGQYRVRGNSAYGGGALALPGDPQAPGWPKKSYATWIVLGTHGSSPVEAQVAEVAAVQGMTLTAQTGSVASQGPSGVADASVRTYTPAGWDPVHGALTFAAAGNRLDANIALGAGTTLRHPLLVVRGFGGNAYPQVKLNGVTLAIDQDYFPSLRSATGELWLTLNRDLSGAANRIEILP